MRTDFFSNRHREWRTNHDQMCWENALESYDRWLKLRDKVSAEELRQACEKQLQHYREQFPQLLKVFGK